MLDKMDSVDRVGLAQDFFRFAYRIGTPISYGIKHESLFFPEVIIFGNHSMAAEEFEMPEDAFELCGTILERLAYRLLAMELNSALEKKFGGWKERRVHKNDIIRNSSIIIWIIRNAVAHDILEPVWKIDDITLQNQKFTVDGIMVFDTSGINGKFLKRLDFGGPIALFRLSEKVLPLL